MTSLVQVNCRGSNNLATTTSKVVTAHCSWSTSYSCPHKRNAIFLLPVITEHSWSPVEKYVWDHFRERFIKLMARTSLKLRPQVWTHLKEEELKLHHPKSLFPIPTKWANKRSKKWKENYRQQSKHQTARLIAVTLANILPHQVPEKGSWASPGFLQWTVSRWVIVYTE